MNTVSAVAAALWKPFLSKGDPRTTEWCRHSYDTFMELVKNPKTGVILKKGVNYETEPINDPEWTQIVTGYKRLDKDQLIEGMVDGYEWDAMIIEMPIYLEYLQERFRQKFGKTINRAVSSFTEAIGDNSLIVNCTGLGSRELANDSTINPVKGQIVSVKKPTGFDNVILADSQGNTIYLIPRSNDLIIGGSVEENPNDDKVDIKITDSIIQRSLVYLPEDTKIDSITRYAGYRPSRYQVRLEHELIDGINVVHNYGHGGSGVTYSWGCAREVAEIVKTIKL
jgi:D-amino-acid oxidase